MLHRHVVRNLIALAATFAFALFAHANIAPSAPTGSAQSSSGKLPSGKLVLWLKADAGVKASGGKVTKWADQSGNGNDVTPTDSDGSPSIVPAAIQNLPIVHFDGASSELRKILTTHPSGTFTCYVVAQAATRQKDKTQGGQSDRIISCPATGGADWDKGLEVPVDTASTFGPKIFTGKKTMSPDQSLTCYGLGAYFNKDGSHGGGFWLTGDIAEVIIYNRELTDAEDAQVRNYLKKKWGAF